MLFLIYMPTSILRDCYTQTLLNTNTVTHKHFYTQTLLHTCFYTQTLLHTDAFTQRSFYTQKLLHTSPDNLEIATLPQFLAIEPHFVRKGCDGNPEIAMLQLSFGRSNLVSCERVAPDDLNSQCYNSVLGDRTSFRAKGWRRTP